MKTQTKISIYFTLIFILVLTIFSGSVYYFAIRYAFDDFYKMLEIRAVVAAKALLEEDETDASVFEDVRREHLEKLPNEQEYFIKVTDDEDLLLDAKKIGVPVSFLNEILENRLADYRSKNTFYAGVFYEDNQGNYIIIVSAENRYNNQHFVDLKRIFLFVILVTTAFVLTISIVFSRYVLTPVKNITKRVKDISTNSLHLRLSPLKGKDEISELTSTFNDMLNRLETSFETQNNFVSNASHELRTPLTTIIGETDLALSKKRSEEEYVLSLQTIAKEAERLDNITRSLLFLAQTGFGGTKQNLVPIRMDELVWQAKHTIDKINPTNKVRVDLSMLPENEEKIKVLGIESLLHLAITNIIGNACKYSYNQPVDVCLTSTDNKVLLIVTDKGIGIPQEDLPHIYDPFFRAANTHQFEGYGIGLPLARNIVRLHRGDILVNSEVNKGTVIQLSFPVAHTF